MSRTIIGCLVVGDRIFVRPPMIGDTPGHCWPANTGDDGYVAQVRAIERHPHGHRATYDVHTSHGAMLNRPHSADVVLASRNANPGPGDDVEIGMIEAAQEADLSRRLLDHERH